MRWSIPATMLFVAAAVMPARSSGAERPAGVVQLFYRMLGSQSNGPFVRKTRTVAARDGAAKTGITGMADAGFTEYPFCSDRWSFTFREHCGLFPRIAGHVPIDTTRVNTCDILIDWVYEPDGCVWGPSCREMAQSFTARGRELVAVTVLVATPRGTFQVSVHEARPDGPRIAPERTFTSGHSLEWGTARWRAGEAPLVPGRTYCVTMRREDGKPWTPYFHSTGNVYDAGQAYLDGAPRPESDLAVWIMEEPEDVSRAVVPGTDADGWIRAVRGVTVVPRTPDLRLISVEFQPVTTFCVNLVAFVWEDESKQRLRGGPKHCVACARPDGEYIGSFLFGPEELRGEPGVSQYVEIFTVPFEEKVEPRIPDDRSALPLRDLRVYAYGETVPGARPVIANLTAKPVGADSLALSWRLSARGSVLIEVLPAGGRAPFKHVPPPGATETVISGLEPGTDCDFTVTAFGPGAGAKRPSCHAWRSPVYRVRMPGGAQEPSALWPETPAVFVPLAPRPALEPLRPEAPLLAVQVVVPGGDFESGLGAWIETRAGIGSISGGEAGIAPRSGTAMYGWTHRPGKERRDVLLENGIHQQVPAVPGHWYELSLYAVTDVGTGPRGDARVRLAADPAGGRQLGGANASQWFWTAERWMRLSHRFQARAERVTIAVDLFRWRDLDRASAYVDEVRLFDLGTSVE